jgi:hypothetical protein
MSAPLSQRLALVFGLDPTHYDFPTPLSPSEEILQALKMINFHQTYEVGLLVCVRWRDMFAQYDLQAPRRPRRFNRVDEFFPIYGQEDDSNHPGYSYILFMWQDKMYICRYDRQTLLRKGGEYTPITNVRTYSIEELTLSAFVKFTDFASIPKYILHQLYNCAAEAVTTLHDSMQAIIDEKARNSIALRVVSSK